MDLFLCRVEQQLLPAGMCISPRTMWAIRWIKITLAFLARFGRPSATTMFQTMAGAGWESSQASQQNVTKWELVRFANIELYLSRVIPIRKKQVNYIATTLLERHKRRLLPVFPQVRCYVLQHREHMTFYCLGRQLLPKARHSNSVERWTGMVYKRSLTICLGFPSLYICMCNDSSVSRSCNQGHGSESHGCKLRRHDTSIRT